ncbi:GXWXG domain-containing protein [Actinotalea solisilvae]|uniref:GXWXG domain-containing protein n=1 Tax=Actinotalea solisilvae TaxID=2072922 RepID=UPI0018F20D78|nr:GXWXG domain-containing protein [Actinotalea solisilvae]
MTRSRRTAAGLERYDALPPVECSELRGLWRGSGVPTGHPLDGALENLGWFGKRFDDDDRVHPLVFRARRGLASVHPGLVPLTVVLRAAPLLRTAAAAGAFAVVRPWVTTRRPRARLREVRFHGVTSAALVYDDLPVIDAFRRDDDGSVIGAMDARGMARPFLFRLHRLDGPARG